MKILTDKKITRHLILQSLPIILAAIVIVIYALSFLPYSTSQMKRCVALVESVSSYCIYADGKPVAWFKDISDSLMPEGLSPSADTTVLTKAYATGCWVNKYPLLPSCKGYLLIANNDSTAGKRIATANKNLHKIIEKKATDIEADIRLMERKIDETDYYMSVHNVNDDGYNVVAEYSTALKESKSKAEKVLDAMRKAIGRKQLEIKIVTKYTLLHDDNEGNTVRTECNVLTTDATQQFRLLQTADKKKPDGHKAVYLHQWLTPSADNGDSVVIASIPGCTLHGFIPDKAQAMTSGGAANGRMSHDTPALLAPDGSPVFSEYGFFIGFETNGKITKPSRFGFAMKHLLP